MKLTLFTENGMGIYRLFLEERPPSHPNYVSDLHVRRTVKERRKLPVIDSTRPLPLTIFIIFVYVELIYTSFIESGSPI